MRPFASGRDTSASVAFAPTSRCVAARAISVPSAVSRVTLRSCCPFAFAGTLKLSSPISPGVKLHSVWPKGRPAERVMPSVRPLMTTVLREGSGSALSSVRANGTSPPAAASRLTGAVSATLGMRTSCFRSTVSSGRDTDDASICAPPRCVMLKDTGSVMPLFQATTLTATPDKIVVTISPAMTAGVANRLRSIGSSSAALRALARSGSGSGASATTLVSLAAVSGAKRCAMSDAVGSSAPSLFATAVSRSASFRGGMM